MALIKPVATPFGPNACYWHIFGLDLNRPQQAARLTIAGYVDAEARASGCRPIANFVIEFPAGTWPCDAESLRIADLYDAIKQVANDPAHPAAVLSGAVNG